MFVVFYTLKQVPVSVHDPLETAAQMAGEHTKSFAYAWDWVVCVKLPLLPLPAREAKKVGNLLYNENGI